MKSTRSEGSQAIVSPRVCAGPTSSRRTSRSPTRSSSSPPKVSVGARRLDALEVEAAEAAQEELAQGPHLGRLRDQRRHRRRRQLLHLGRGALGGDDPCSGEQLVAVAVVAVGVRVDERADLRRRRHRPAHLGEHRLGQRQVEQRVDQQRRLAVADQPGVRPAPAAVGLQVGEDALADLRQPALVARRHRRADASGWAAAGTSKAPLPKLRARGFRCGGGAAGRERSRSGAQDALSSRSSSARSRTCVRRIELPDGSRKPESMPYGRSSGASLNSTPRARSSS